MPEAAELACQENEILDYNEGKVGENLGLSAIGKNVRVFRFYVLSEGNDGGYGIRTMRSKVIYTYYADWMKTS